MDVTEKVMEETKKDAVPVVTAADPAQSQMPASEEQRKLETEWADLHRREKELEDRIHKVEAERMLTTVGLPETFSKYVKGNTLDETEQNIADLKKVFDEEVQKQVVKQMKGTTPRVGSGIGTGIHGISDSMNIQSQVREALI